MICCPGFVTSTNAKKTLSIIRLWAT